MPEFPAWAGASAFPHWRNQYFRHADALRVLERECLWLRVVTVLETPYMHVPYIERVRNKFIEREGVLGWIGLPFTFTAREPAFFDEDYDAPLPPTDVGDLIKMFPEFHIWEYPIWVGGPQPCQQAAALSHVT